MILEDLAKSVKLEKIVAQIKAEVLTKIKIK